jgi:ubiquinone/menaquinone biosynthesis C-methylase UbiE
MNQKDKTIEKNRYDLRAINHIESNSSDKQKTVLDIPITLRKPYIIYEEYLKSILNKKVKVLEIGSGTGEHTYLLVKSGAEVIASDISSNSLKILKNRYKDFENFKIKVADMESLPFESNSFDIVCSAGSLSYGDHILVRNEINRVLKPDGHFVCVDSLNHNPIYIFNRFINYIRKDRSKSVIERIPSFKLIKSYEQIFLIKKISFFGSLTWLSPLISFIFGDNKAANLLDWFDKIIKVRKSAFKFVLLAKNK